jgi:hypothetical protein
MSPSTSASRSTIAAPLGGVTRTDGHGATAAHARDGVSVAVAAPTFTATGTQRATSHGPGWARRSLKGFAAAIVAATVLVTAAPESAGAAGRAGAPGLDAGTRAALRSGSGSAWGFAPDPYEPRPSVNHLLRQKRRASPETRQCSRRPWPGVDSAQAGAGE